MISITFTDILSMMNKGCKLRTRFEKENKKKIENQFYRLRFDYCKLKLNNLINNKNETLSNVTEDMKTFWELCKKNLTRLLNDGKINIDETFFSINTELGPVTIDGHGTLNGHECLFKFVFGSRWKKKHSIQLVKWLDFLSLSRNVENISLVGIILGTETDENNKMIRILPENDELYKNGKIKNEGWNKLRAEFETGLIKTQEIFNEIMNEENYANVGTNPSECGFCPYHNIVIDEDMGCTGFYHTIR